MNRKPNNCHDLFIVPDRKRAAKRREKEATSDIKSEKIHCSIQ